MTVEYKKIYYNQTGRLKKLKSRAYRKRLRKKASYLIQAAIFIPLFYLLKILPTRQASALGGWLCRRFTYHTRMTKVAFKNLAVIYPDKDLAWRKQIVQRMWDNLGRTFAEVPHLQKLRMGTDIAIEGSDILQNTESPIIFFSAHFGNWEVLAKTAASLSVSFHRVYRKSNNPYLEAFIQARRGEEAGGFIPKGKEGGKQMMRLLREKQNIGMLLDQKMNNGIKSTFMNRQVTCPDAAARLAHRRGIPLVPAYALRTYSPKGQPQFIVKVMEPLELGDTIEETVQRINDTLENFIREYPEQWFWVHRRFRDVDYD